MLRRRTILRGAWRANAARSGHHVARVSSTAHWSAPLAQSEGPRARAGAGEEKRSKALEFALLVDGLQTFHTATGHFLVPFHFPIPMKHADGSEDASAIGTRILTRLAGGPVDVQWADELRGLNLGRVLHTFMVNKKHHDRYPLVVSALRDIGFPVDLDWSEYLWCKLTLDPLRTYYHLEGHLLVPTDFEVPFGDTRWPRHTWGFRLGTRVHRLRQKGEKLEPHELEDLEKLDFSFDVVETTWSAKILPSLETYVHVFGHCHVKRAFVVPAEEPWPKKAWGLPLGSIVSAIRSKDGYAKQVARDAEQLDKLQFVWDYRESTWSEVVLPSLEAHFAVHGHSRVSREFVVPSCAPWPKKAWGYALGVSVNHMRSNGTYAHELRRDHERVQAINFVWGLREHRWRECILPSLEVFAEQYGHCRVPRDFVVPAETPWPDEAWDLKLGNHVNDIRYTGSYSNFVLEDATHLRVIGFLETMPALPVRTNDFWESRESYNE